MRFHNALQLLVEFRNYVFFCCFFSMCFCNYSKLTVNPLSSTFDSATHGDLAFYVLANAPWPCKICWRWMGSTGRHSGAFCVYCHSDCHSVPAGLNFEYFNFANFANFGFSLCSNFKQRSTIQISQCFWSEFLTTVSLAQSKRTNLVNTFAICARTDVPMSEQVTSHSLGPLCCPWNGQTGQHCDSTDTWEAKEFSCIAC